MREQLQGFWIVPGAVALTYAALALLLIKADRASSNVRAGFGFGGDAGAARGVLSAVAGGVISMASLTLSLTIVTLQLASSQFTPRALKDLLGDRVNQVVAGSFVGTVAYALLALRVVRENDEPDPGFVPALTVTVCIGLALLALALLLLFVHHVGQIIKVEHVAADIGHQTLRAAQRLYPDPWGGAPEPDSPRPPGPPARVFPRRLGYVQTVALTGISGSFDGRAARIEVLLAPGDFATPGPPAALVWPREALGHKQREMLQRAISISNERDVRQDVGFGIRKLTDIALRAVSPAVNDPTTATTCIGYLTAILERLAGHGLPAKERQFAEQNVRVHARHVCFESHLETAFLEIARYAAADARVVGALLDGLGRVAVAASAAGAEARAQATLRLADEIREAGVEAASVPRDRSRLQQRAHALPGPDSEDAPTGTR